ncbi:hypothetical protein EVAR_58090_1 [Eumeta japonica]|uniref:Uncharacterized protein n=1 Tax=Eumeta variegata TaxID=151549 RepID=A0A4C1YNV3_EUMVA|nr:hypothetical protein EVAR_58090_1 [Eumeta japonica]
MTAVNALAQHWTVQSDQGSDPSIRYDRSWASDTTDTRQHREKNNNSPTRDRQTYAAGQGCEGAAHSPVRPSRSACARVGDVQKFLQSQQKPLQFRLPFQYEKARSCETRQAGSGPDQPQRTAA